MEFTPVTIGRGRGLKHVPDASKGQVRKLGFSSRLDMVDTTPVVKPNFSTPAATNCNILEQLYNQLGELGTQIGDTIARRI